jgi:hypothetical protein
VRQVARDVVAPEGDKGQISVAGPAGQHGERVGHRLAHICGGAWHGDRDHKRCVDTDSRGVADELERVVGAAVQVVNAQQHRPVSTGKRLQKFGTASKSSRRALAGAIGAQENFVRAARAPFTWADDDLGLPASANLAAKLRVPTRKRL